VGLEDGQEGAAVEAVGRLAWAGAAGGAAAISPAQGLTGTASARSAGTSSPTRQASAAWISPVRNAAQR